MSQSDLNLHLWPKQGLAFQSLATEIFYGGAAGGGKSHLMRVASVVFCASIPGLQVYLFRRIRDDLVKNHVEGPKGFRALLAEWDMAGLAKIVDDEIRFWNGSKIYLCHCKDEKDIYKYQGAEIHLLLIDEITHFTEKMYRFLRHRVRMVGLTLTKEFQGMFPRILCSGNPGNIGHFWVKQTFIDRAKESEIRVMPMKEGGMKRQFIRAQLEDNPSMAVDDPGYEDRLEGLGSDALVRAMRWGDWDAIEGAFFDFDQRRLVVKPQSLPDHWLRFRSMDWGFAKPFSVGWWAVASEDYDLGLNWPVPKGAMIRYREWYGVKISDGQVMADEGLRMTADQVAVGIKSREENEDISYGVLDPSAFAEDGGPSIAERMADCGVFFKRADNRRVSQKGAVSGWDLMRSRIKGEDGHPMIYCFSTCVDSIRTLPAMQHDDTRPEDMDTDLEDHCFTADTLVRTSNGLYSFADLIGKEGHVRSHDGAWHRFRSVRLVKRDQSIVRLTFSDGTAIRCTPDHRFLTAAGWRDAKDLTGIKILSLSRTRSRSSTAGAIIFAAVDTIAPRVSFYIGLYGRKIAGRFLTAGTSTIRIATGTTTRLRTWIACLPLPINPVSMVLNMGRAASFLSSKLLSVPEFGMGAMLASGGTRSNTTSIARLPYSRSEKFPAANAGTQQRSEITTEPSAPTNANRHGGVLRDWTTSSAPAPFATRRSRPTNTPRSRHAREPAGPYPALAAGPVCLSVSEAGRADVYCFTVPDTGNFELANGMIAAQCADEWRYACASRPWMAKRPKSTEIDLSKPRLMTMEDMIAAEKRSLRQTERI